MSKSKVLQPALSVTGKAGSVAPAPAIGQSVVLQPSLGVSGQTITIAPDPA